MDHLTSIQLSEWEAYDKLDPIGTWREDFRMAFLSSLISNLAISINGAKGSKMTSTMDFMPNWSGEEREEVEEVMSPEQILNTMKIIADAQNKKVAKGIQPKTSKPKAK